MCVSIKQYWHVVWTEVPNHRYRGRARICKKRGPSVKIEGKLANMAPKYRLNLHDLVVKRGGAGAKSAHTWIRPDRGNFLVQACTQICQKIHLKQQNEFLKKNGVLYFFWGGEGQGIESKVHFLGQEGPLLLESLPLPPKSILVTGLTESL